MSSSEGTAQENSLVKGLDDKLSKLWQFFVCLKDDNLAKYQQIECKYEDWDVVNDLIELLKRVNFNDSGGYENNYPTGIINWLLGESGKRFKEFCQIQPDTLSHCNPNEYYKETLYSSLKALGNDPFRDKISKRNLNANVLSLAVMSGAQKISKFLISKNSKQLLSEKCTTTCVHKTGEKRTYSCLYYIAKGDFVDLVKSVFSHATETEKSSLIKDEAQEDLGHYARRVSWFHIACHYGSTEVVKFCLKELNMDCNKADSHGQTPLFRAIKEDHYDIASLLLNHGADGTLEDKHRVSPLYIAAERNLKDIFKKIIANCKDYELSDVYPLLIASKKGNKDIVEILIDSKFPVWKGNEREETAMHVAAGSDNKDIMAMLHGVCGDQINKQTKSRETPMHYAIEKGNIKALKFLLERGAQIPWNAAFRSRNLDSLKTILECDENHIEEKSDLFHELVKSLDSKEMLELLVQYKTTDGDYSLLRNAARYGRAKILYYCLKQLQLDPNLCDADKNTALHEAAKAGKAKAVGVLIKHCQVDAQNVFGDTALHSAIKSNHTAKPVVKEIVENSSLDQLNRSNKDSDTALHLAAKYNKPHVVPLLTELDILQTNNDKDNALHAAARCKNMEVLREMLRCFELKPDDINKKTEDGETLLHLIAKGGHYQMVSVLVDYGIDLTIKDDTGNTFLHDLAEKAGADPENKMYNRVFDEIVDNVLKWWSKCLKGQTLENEGTHQAEERQKDALVLLISGIKNKKKLTALQVAVKQGACSLVASMIQVPKIFKKNFPDEDWYDVTDLLPDPNTTLKFVDSQNQHDNAVEEDEEVQNKGIENKALIKETPKSVKESLLETIAFTRPMAVANKMLDIEPLNLVTDDYWKLYQFITTIPLCIHLIHMLALSLVAIPEIEKAVVSNASANFTAMDIDKPNPHPIFTMFLLWPLCILSFQVYYTICRLYAFWKKGHAKQAYNVHLAKYVIRRFFIDTLICIFPCLSIVWFYYYITSNKYHGVLLAYVELVGWLSAMAFTGTHRQMHGFIIMLQKVFTGDVLRFLVLYVFILFAFGFGFECLIRLNSKVFSEFGSSSEVFFHTFAMLLGVGDVMIEDIEEKFRGSGYSPIHYKLFYLLYALVTVVVLLNILIAMMNDSYSDIKKREEISHRVSSIRSAFRFEKAFPQFRTFSTKFRAIQLSKRYHCEKKPDQNNRRWMVVTHQKSDTYT